jgi:hypothetical protein
VNRKTHEIEEKKIVEFLEIFKLFTMVVVNFWSQIIYYGCCDQKKKNLNG